MSWRVISSKNDLPFSVLQSNKTVDFTALMCIFREKLQLAWDCSFACFGPQAAINAGSGRGNICGSFLFRALVSAGSQSSLGCVRQSQSMRDLYVVLHGLAG